jgi:hypothetical protein
LRAGYKPRDFPDDHPSTKNYCKKFTKDIKAGKLKLRDQETRENISLFLKNSPRNRTYHQEKVKKS